MAQRSRAVVLVSGGLDSAVTLACALRDGREAHTITFDYGQRHRHELDAAAAVADAAGIGPGRRVRLEIGLRAIGGSALTDDAIGVPKDGARADAGSDIPVTYVPARNLIFLSCAAAYAETIGADRLYLGVNAVDYSGYPDCREEFLGAFEGAVNLGTKAGVEGRRLRVVAPLVRLSKAEIIRLGSMLGVNLGLTHSCYDPVATLPGDDVIGSVRACGRCDSCRIRRAGFAEAGVPDPTVYAQSRGGC